MAQETSLEALARARGEQQNTEPETAVIGESASVETLTPEQLARVEENKTATTRWILRPPCSTA